MVERYAHLSPNHKAEAIERIVRQQLPNKIHSSEKNRVEGDQVPRLVSA